MTDADLLEKKLAFIESCVADLRRLAVVEKLGTDVKERRFIEAARLRAEATRAARLIGLAH